MMLVLELRYVFTLILICDLRLSVIAASSEKLRFCLVAPRETESQTSERCNELMSMHDRRAECDIELDRLTCLRRVVKGLSDFTTLQVEDVIVASKLYSNVITVTNELRALAKQQFEYDVVAVVRNTANISSIQKLKNSTFCHPGSGYETDWSGVVSRFLESRLVPQQCDPTLTLTENSLSSASKFFRAACKAGPWVPDADLDAELKSRYPSLCALCESPQDCSKQDKYWGPRGPLFCLTDGAGDVVWTRLDYVHLHFTPEDQSTDAEGDVSQFSLLCPDGTLQPLEIITDKNAKPCIWISRPWPSIVAQRDKAEDVRALVESLPLFESGSWQNTLSMLVAPYGEHTPKIKNFATLEEQLVTAQEWLNAATVSPCGALGAPRMCVHNKKAGIKCQWLSESARAYGIQGAPLCVVSENCLAAVANDQADVTIIHPNLLYTAKVSYGLKFLMYELPKNKDEVFYHVLLLFDDKRVKKLEGVRGKRACFPTYNGASWLRTWEFLQSVDLIGETCADDANPFKTIFSSVCVTRKNNASIPLCSDGPGKDQLFDESDALQSDLETVECLLKGKGDVAFVNKMTMDYVLLGPDPRWRNHPSYKDIVSECSGPCNLGLAPLGTLITRDSERDAKVRQWRTMFQHLNEIFGPEHFAPTTSMLIYGSFNNQTNLIFHNTTNELVRQDTLVPRFGDDPPFQPGFIETIFNHHSLCTSLATTTHSKEIILILILITWSLTKL